MSTACGYPIKLKLINCDPVGTNRSVNVRLCHIFHQTFHFTAVFEDFRAFQKAQCHILDLSWSHMVEFTVLFDFFLLAAIFLCAGKQVLESMDCRSLPRYAKDLGDRSRYQLNFRPFDFDSTSTSYMEPADVYEQKDRNFCRVSFWYFVSLKRSFFVQ